MEATAAERGMSPEPHTPESKPMWSVAPAQKLAIGVALLELEPKLLRRISREEVSSRGLLKTVVEDKAKSLTRRNIASSLEHAFARRPSKEQIVEAGFIPDFSARTLPEPAEGIWQYEMASQRWQSSHVDVCSSPQRLAMQFGYRYENRQGNRNC